MTSSEIQPRAPAGMSRTNPADLGGDRRGGGNGRKQVGKAGSEGGVLVRTSRRARSSSLEYPMARGGDTRRVGKPKLLLVAWQGE